MLTLTAAVVRPRTPAGPARQLLNTVQPQAHEGCPPIRLQDTKQSTFFLAFKEM